MNKKQLLVPIGSKRRKGRKLKYNKGVTIHEAGTPNASAQAHAKNQYNNCNAAVNGWHWTVDDKEAWQSFPNNEIAEHSGKRLGNDSTVAIEIADKVTNGEYWNNAVNNAAKLVADILIEKGFKKAVHKQNIWQHYDWSGKNCPYQIRKGNPIKWTAFVDKVNEYMGAEIQPIPTPTPIPQPTLTAIVNVGELNLRESGNTNSKVLKVLKKGDKVGLDKYVKGEKWARVYSSDTLGYVWLEYITTNEKEEPLNWQVDVNKLNFREEPNSNSKILKVLTKGDKVRLDRYVESEEWARVYVDNVLGYVWREYIEEK